MVGMRFTGRDPFSTSLVDIANHDLRLVRSEMSRVSSAETLRRASDENNSVFDYCLSFFRGASSIRSP